MCGIAGYIGNKMPYEKNIHNCMKSLANRGPDGSGIYQSRDHKNILLIHRRLAIIDLDQRSNQPFRVGNKLLIFNGEIYNYIELRSQLKTLGYKFVTDSDTEVLAKSLLQWGDLALSKLEGMWSFAWFDEESGELLLSRDRFGEKPLYKLETEDGIFLVQRLKL